MAIIETEFRRDDAAGEIGILLDTDSNLATCDNPCRLDGMVSHRARNLGGEGIICTSITKKGEVINGQYGQLIPEGEEAFTILNTDHFPQCAFPDTETLPKK